MQKKIINIKELIKGIIAIGLYFTLPSLISIPFIFLSKHIAFSTGTLTLLLYLILVIIFSIIYIKTLKKDFPIFKKNIKPFFKIGINYWIKGLFIMFTSSFLITILNIEQNTNQSTNITLLEQYPLVEIICAIILAPILEELVFRRSLKNFTTNKHLYAFTTGLIFGGAHVISSLTSPIMLLYLIPYCSVGIAFGYIYEKTDNIYSSLLIHSLHNTISILENNVIS